MLAAVGGVAYTLATLLKLQSYLGYLQPMPVVVAAMRWGPSAGRKTMTATTFLLLGVWTPRISWRLLSMGALLTPEGSESSAERWFAWCWPRNTACWVEAHLCHYS